VKDIYPAVLKQWHQANALFKPPVINDRRTILGKIQDSWNLAVDISQGRKRLVVKEQFLSKLDKLFDIVNCKF
jgi:pyruvate carboxylase